MVKTSKNTPEDKAFDLYAEMLISKIETTKKSNWEKPWFTDRETLWPKSLYGKSYNGMNALMLSWLCEKKGYRIPVFATYERIFSLNFVNNSKGDREPAVDKEGNKLPYACVNKKEHSFPVFLTQVNIVKKEDRSRVKLSWSDYVKLSQEEKKDYEVYFNRRVYNVFNIDQTNIKETRPELYQKLLEENTPKKLERDDKTFVFEPLDVMIDRDLWICPIKPVYGDKARYSHATKDIIVPLKEQFKSGESFYSNLLHEMGHSTGDKNHLDRLKPSSFGSDNYAREELVAELGAAILSLRYGFGSRVIKEDSIPYVQGWLDSLHKDPNFIRTVLNDVKFSTNLIDVYIEKVRKLCLEEKEGDKIDIREDNTATLEFDESGDAHISGDINLLPDKKEEQGVSRSSDVTAQTKPEEHHRGGIGR